MTRRREESRLLRILGEFVVIVAGVLVALAADRWNQGRVEAEAEAEYVARLEAEIRADSLRAEEFLAIGPSISAANETLMGIVRGGEAAPANLVATIASAFRELVLPTPATWNDLQSTGALALIDDLRIRTTVVDYYAEREEIALQVERSVRRGRDPFLDQLYPMGLFHPAGAAEAGGNCLEDSCFRPVPVERFATWPGILDLLEGLESGHGAQQLHAKRLITSSGAALAELTGAAR